MSDRTEPAFTASEKDMLCGWLDFQRATIVRKVDGLADDDLRRPVVGSGTSLLGIVKHLAFAESYWFGQVFAGESERLARFEPGDHLSPDEATGSVVDRYATACGRSREIVHAADLDDFAHGTVTNRRGPASQFTLRWIVTHMIEETARHAGHADILREQIDGTTGA
jgi:uncharacterized damage-inducible protein DinB